MPTELYASFRHIGGVSTSRHDRTQRGLTGTDGPPPAYRAQAQLAEDVVAGVESELGRPLPMPYREYLAASNGGRPEFPAVHPRAGFIVDQPLFGVVAQVGDVLTDLLHQQVYLSDRLEPGLLPIGFVQGGTLVLNLEHGSVYHLDDDDPYDQQGYTPDAITRNLLRYLEQDFAAFWTSFRAVPASLRELAVRHAVEGWARVLSHPSLGRGRPGDRRC